MKRDLLTISDLGAADFEAIASRAVELGRCWRERSLPQTLARTHVGLIEELPGWRNPSALSLGAAAMGATCVSINAKLEGAETAEDLAGYMDNWFDLLGIRTPRLSSLRSFAGAIEASVVNLRTNDDHPCEILGDLSFVLHERGSWGGLRVAMVGPRGNIAQSWIEAAGMLPIELVHVTPPGFGFTPDELPDRVSTSDDARELEDADLIVTDCWPDDLDPEAKSAFARLRVDASLLDRCRPDVLFVPCPPVTRGQEVSADAMCHPRLRSKEAKAFLLHSQNAGMEYCLRDKTIGF